MGHWYQTDGTERYDAGIKIAREEGLLPSVTTILGVIDDPWALKNWRTDQAIMQTMTLPTIENEPPDAYVARVKRSMDDEQEKTTGIGRGVHSLCELYLGSEAIDAGKIPVESYRAYEDSKVEVYLKQMAEAAGGTGQTEQVVVSPMGYAGRMDYGWGGDSVWDFKSQGVKEREGKASPGFYQDWARQLAAYAIACGRVEDAVDAAKYLEQCSVGSVIISTSRHRGSWERKWSTKALVKGWWIFVAAFELWKVLNGYDPSGSLAL